MISSGQTCLTLGGDHSLSIGTVHGHCKAETRHDIGMGGRARRYQSPASIALGQHPWHGIVLPRARAIAVYSKSRRI